MFRWGFQVDYGGWRPVALLNWYHIACLNVPDRFVHQAVCCLLSPLRSDCGSSSNTMFWGLCLTELSVLVSFHKLCERASARVSSCVETRLGPRSTVSSRRHRSFSIYLLYEFIVVFITVHSPFSFPPELPKCQRNALLRKTEHALPTLSLNQWSMWI